MHFIGCIDVNRGILSIGHYIFMSGLVYISLSVLLIFKREKAIVASNIMDLSSEESDSLTPFAVYQRIFGLLKLPNMRKLIFILLVNRVLC